MTIGTPMLWAAFVAAVLAMLALDLGVFHRRAHAVSMREALIWSAVWIALSLAFNAFIGVRFGADAGLDFLSAYLIEKSLSVDNLFVFIVVFAAFGVAPAAQHRVLFWGILGALVMRSILIFGGIALLQRFEWLIYPLGGFLVLTGLKLFRDRHRAESAEPGRLIRWLRGHTNGFGSTMMALVAIELTDAVFAVDSVPAVLAVTEDPFLVFTSNICALLGLRSLYFALAGVVSRFRYLKVSLACILVFVGAKMTASNVMHLPHGVSLGTIALLLGAGVIASLLKERSLRSAAAPTAPPAERSWSSPATASRRPRHGDLHSSP
jgi:tellurite resistance protein TerC